MPYAKRSLVGYVDWLLRPLVSLRVVGNDDPLLATVDTGFSGDLAMGSLEALAHKVTMYEPEKLVETASGTQMAGTGHLRIIWFQQELLVEVLVFQERRTNRFSDSSVLLGARLLRDKKLFINYMRSSVIIR